jgi:CheY-like chemotaxis protein
MLENMRVLVVDDHESMIKTVSSNLQNLGCRDVYSANHGKAALQLLEAHGVDIIISDWNMPVMDGLEFLKAVRASDEYSNIPFLMVTAEADRESVMKALEAGVSDYLIKPFTVFALQKHIQRAKKNKNGSKVKTVNTQPTKAEDVMGLPDVEPAVYVKPDGSPTTVLVIDDVPDNIDVIAGYLKDNFKVKAATSGEKGLKVAQSAVPPDLILLDIMMPEMDGYEVCRRLKADPNTRHIPIIFLTAKDQEDDVVKGLEMGAVDYVTKPANAKILNARIHTHLKLSRALIQAKNHAHSAVQHAKLREDVDRIMQHDMRTPLQLIIAEADTLINDRHIDRKVRDTVANMQTKALDLSRQMTASLELLKMETDRYQIPDKKAEINDVLANVIEVLTPLRKELGVKIVKSADPDLFVKGDADLLFFMFSNLLKNAMEASDPGQSVSINCEEKGGKLRIDIENLKQVPEEIMGTFFDKYVTKDKPGGTGLGTYSARLIAESHDAKIGMKSSMDNGTLVWLEFPPV